MLAKTATTSFVSNVNASHQTSLVRPVVAMRSNAGRSRTVRCAAQLTPQDMASKAIAAVAAGAILLAPASAIAGPTIPNIAGTGVSPDNVGSYAPDANAQERATVPSEGSKMAQRVSDVLEGSAQGEAFLGTGPARERAGDAAKAAARDSIEAGKRQAKALDETGGQLRDNARGAGSTVADFFRK